ncbi:MAG TPA: FHA domain-containing protein [Gemmatimonadaceae bacterium]|nr:FHA domain-containing protein [Gemmatimonadaceae bacterium]
MAFLELHEAPDAGSARIELGPLTIVGSGSQATWRLPRLNLAARHFRIAVEPDGRATVEPATAQNIVLLNGEPVPQNGMSLATGDVIAAGSAFFHFVERPDAPRRAIPEQASGYLVNESERTAYTLDRRAIQIGRDIGCHVVVRDASVSRFHADIRDEAGAYVLYSMGSAGSFVNDQRVSSPRVLQNGDRVTVGETAFLFVLGGLPTGTRCIPFSHDRGEDATNRRATQLGVQAVRGGQTLTGSRTPVMVAVAIVVALAGLYLALR